jgi:hypothetical protein
MALKKYVIVKTENTIQIREFFTLSDAQEEMRWLITFACNYSPEEYRFDDETHSYVSVKDPKQRWCISENYEKFSHEDYILQIKVVERPLVPCAKVQAHLMRCWSDFGGDKRALLLSIQRDDAFWREFFGIPSWAKADFSGAEEIYSNWVDEMCG